MRVVGGEERLEVNGSTDAFEWVATDALEGRRLGDLVERVLVELGGAGSGEPVRDRR